MTWHDPHIKLLPLFASVLDFGSLDVQMDEKRNGLSRVPLPKAWSPQNTPLFSPPTVADLIKDAGSDTASDSDSDIN